MTLCAVSTCMTCLEDDKMDLNIMEGMRLEQEDNE